MPFPVTILIGFIVIALIAKVSTVDIYYRKLKADKNAKANVAFQSLFGGFVSLNIQRYLFVKELPPFPSSYSVYLKYQQRIQRLNRFTSICLFLLLMYAGYKILLLEFFEIR